MNEEAIKSMYAIARKEGYKDSIEDFSTLMSQNSDALNTMYSLAKANGYKDNVEDFSVLMGSKKKRRWGKWCSFWRHLFAY